MTAQPRTSDAIGAAPTPAESSAAESPAPGSSVAESPLAESPLAAPLPASSPPAPRESRRGRWREAAEADPGRDRVGPRLDHRAHRLHVRHQRGFADAVAPAGAPSCRRRVRPAEPALRQVQGRFNDAAGHPGGRRSRAAPPLRGADRGLTRSVWGSPRGRNSRRGRSLRVSERHTHEPRDDDQPAGPDPYVRAAAVHNGPVGDPPALPADPPRDLQRLPIPWLISRPEVRAPRLLRRDEQP